MYCLYNASRAAYYCGYRIVDGFAQPKWTTDRDEALAHITTLAACRDALAFITEVCRVRDRLEIEKVRV